MFYILIRHYHVRTEINGDWRDDLIDILIAEDEKDIAFMYMKLLEERGHNVTVTNDGQECLDVYHDKSSKIMREPANVNGDAHAPFDAVI